jgi:arylsulfatase A-like enzyme
MKLRFLALAAFAAVSAIAAEKKQPNIILIFSDDHAYQAISAYNDPRKLLETPNIDRIGREGMRFDRCLVTNSICGPCRATVLTGVYNHINGFVNNTNSRFDGSQITFPKLLQAAGYQTAMIGKWHLESDPTGFDFWQILYGQGVYYNPPMNRMGTRTPTNGYVTDTIADLSLDWLKNRDKTKPFMLMTQHKAPHRPWEPPLRYLGHDHDRKYPEPATLFDDYSGRGPAEHNQDMMIKQTMTPIDTKFTTPPQLTPEQRAEWDKYYAPRNAKMLEANLQGDDLIRWRYQRYMHDYTGCVKAVDDAVGRVLKFLDDEGLADNTIVIYSSDQGFYLGEHGWFDKRWIFEESIRTPMLVRWPGNIKPGTSSKALVSNLDFAETFLDIAGLPIPDRMQGHSLVSVFRGQTPADWRKSFYYQYFEYPQPHHVAPHFGVVTDRYKLIHFTGGGAGTTDYWELFDMEKDPNELKSVLDDPAYRETRATLEKELARLRTELKVPENIPANWYGNPPGQGKKKKQS